MAVALLGIAHVAFLPPFEGFDEPAHLAYIQEIADTGHIPQAGARLSTDIEDYVGPHPSSERFPELPYMGAVYRAYFSRPYPDLTQPVTRSFRPGNQGDYETQHPPLYYLVMAPFYSIARDWSWPHLMLFLRLVSWSLAFAGFVTGCLAGQRVLATLGKSLAAGLVIPAWPLLFPEFFPEMARLGNDSLCVLLASGALALLIPTLKQPKPGLAIAMGLVLGLGLLTKAFFWPITAGVVLFLALVGWQTGDRRLYRAAAWIAAIATVSGGWWYVRSFVLHGSFFGAHDFDDASRAGGAVHLLGAGFGLAEALTFARGIAVIGASFVWAGTWSLTSLWPVTVAPVLLLLALGLGFWLRDLRRLPIIAWAPLFLVGPFGLSIVYHLVSQVALPGNGAGTPGWYLHVVWAPIALALATGWRRGTLFAGLTGYALLLHAACWATQLSFFSGCAFKPARHAAFELDPGSCLIVPEHLSALGEPLLGTVTLGAAALACIAGWWIARSGEAQLQHREA